MGFPSDKIFKRDIFFGQVVDSSEKGGNPYPSFTVFCDRIGCIVGDRIFVCQRFLQVRDAPVCHIQDVDTGLGCDPVRILTTLLDVANLYIWDDCFRFPVVPVVILTGAYAVAEKYIRILEQTLFYKEWAAEWRKYLYRDDLVEEEPSLGGKRRAWGKGGQYAVSADLLEVWERLAVNNPDRSVAFQYLLSFHLLGKTLNRFDELHRKYYRTKVWPSLSIHQQEAVIALYQKTPRLWPEKGVGMKVELRYGAFDQDMNTKHGYVNFRDVMAGSYGDTYWFYLMFKK